jgi:opacity protein-like surface antigen
MRFLFVFVLFVMGSPALAQENDAFKGGYIGIEGGYADLKASLGGLSASEDSGLIGATIGFRSPVQSDGKFILGVEGNFNFITNGSDLGYGAAAIAGFKTSSRAMVYARAGYVRLDSDVENFDGFQFGGGFEFFVSSRMSLRVDYRRLEFEDFLGANINGNEITLGVNLNF